MAQLIDLVPLTEEVSVGGETVTVGAVSAKGFANLLARFPAIRAMMAGRDVAADELMTSGADAVAAIIAAGCGYPGDATAEAVAASLGADSQADLLAAVLRLTMPGGVGPFVKKLEALGAIGGKAGASGKAPASKSRN